MKNIKSWSQYSTINEVKGPLEDANYKKLAAKISDMIKNHDEEVRVANDYNNQWGNSVPDHYHPGVSIIEYEAEKILKDWRRTDSNLKYLKDYLSEEDYKVLIYNKVIQDGISEGRLMKASNSKDSDVKIDEFRDKINDYLKSIDDCKIKKVGDDFEIHIDNKHVGQVMFRKDLITVKKVGVKFGKEFKYNEFGKVKAEIKNVIK